MLRAAVLSLLLALCGYAAASWLTHGFQVWTDEGARRLEVALQPVDALRCSPSTRRAWRWTARAWPRPTCPRCWRRAAA